MQNRVVSQPGSACSRQFRSVCVIVESSRRFGGALSIGYGNMEYCIEVLGQQVCYRGFLKLVRYRLRHSLFRGGWSRPIERERLEDLRAAVVLLYDPHLDRVVLVEQFRVGLLEQARNAWTLEPVGGVIMPGTDAATTVRREAREEAGCEVLALESIGTFYVSPGFSDDRIDLFCGCVGSERLGGIQGLPEEGEDIRVVKIDAEQAFAELFCGRINSTTAIIGIQWLAANRERLRAKWAGT